MFYVHVLGLVIRMNDIYVGVNEMSIYFYFPPRGTQITHKNMVLRVVFFFHVTVSPLKNHK